MGCLAVLFAQTFFESFPEYVCELDQSWDAMHRMLTDGKLNFENSFPPLCNVIFGGEFVYGLTRQPSGEVIISEGEEDEYMILKTPVQVAEIAEQLPKRTKGECRKCYDMIDSEDYGMHPDEEDFEYTWEYLQDSLGFWKRRQKKKDMYYSRLTDNSVLWNRVL